MGQPSSCFFSFVNVLPVYAGSVNGADRFGCRFILGCIGLEAEYGGGEHEQCAKDGGDGATNGFQTD